MRVLFITTDSLQCDFLPCYGAEFALPTCDALSVEAVVYDACFGFMAPQGGGELGPARGLLHALDQNAQPTLLLSHRLGPPAPSAHAEWTQVPALAPSWADPSRDFRDPDALEDALAHDEKEWKRAARHIAKWQAVRAGSDDGWIWCDWPGPRLAPRDGPSVPLHAADAWCAVADDYRARLRAWDAALGRLLDAVQANEDSSPSLVVCAATCGGWWGAHPWNTPSSTWPYRETIHLPLWIAGAVQGAFLRDARVLSLARLWDWLQGLARGKADPAPLPAADRRSDATVYVTTGQDRWARCSESFHYVQGADPAQAAPRSELYAMPEDATERHNVASLHPALVEEWEGEIASRARTILEGPQP